MFIKEINSGESLSLQKKKNSSSFFIFLFESSLNYNPVRSLRHLEIIGFYYLTLLYLDVALHAYDKCLLNL
jgi:hypothetical protein